MAQGMFVLATVPLIIFLGAWAFDYFSEENVKNRQLKKKLWREFRFTYYEVFNQWSKKEMKDMMLVCDNTFKNSQVSKIRYNEDVVIDFSPHKRRKSMRRVFFDLPPREA